MVSHAYSQPGCTDPIAVNYDPASIYNDGSCIYPATTLSLDFYSTLDSNILNECSGLAHVNNELWTVTDNVDNHIYSPDSVSEQIFKSISLQASAIDWEAITYDSNYIYIGDFGNNSGNRTDLRIYRIQRSQLSDSLINPDVINFYYPDQADFNPALNNNSFDCEAFFCLNDTIHLFTKDWINKITKHYLIPADTGIFQALLVDSFDVNGLVTSASIQDDGLIVLLGYDNTGFAPCFLWMFSDYQNASFFSGNKRMFDLGTAANVGQSEGICFTGHNSGFITNEKLQFGSMNVPASIRRFDLNSYLSTSLETLNSLAGTHFELFHEHGAGVLQIFVQEFSNQSFKITEMTGKEIVKGTLMNNSSVIIMPLCPDGIYNVTIIGKGRTDSKRIFLKF